MSEKFKLQYTKIYVKTKKRLTHEPWALRCNHKRNNCSNGGYDLSIYSDDRNLQLSCLFQNIIHCIDSIFICSVMLHIMFLNSVKLQNG